MKLKKAIEILSRSIKGQWPTPNTDLNDAIKLGIKALKAYQQRRINSPHLPYLKLPGESPEGN